VSVLAIDLGSSGVKVAVVDRDGIVLGSASSPLTTTHTADGGAEQDPEVWWREIGACSRRALDGRGSDVEAVAVTSQYMSIVAVDGRGRPLANTVMWMDGRGTRQLRANADVDVELWLDRHGLVPVGACDQAHIAHLRADRPDVYERAAAFVEPVDHLTARLTGRITSTQNTAFPLMTVDNRRHGATTHDDVLVDRLGIDPSKLAPLVPFDEIVGTVTAEAAAHLGIDPAAVVTSGTIDSVTSAIGCGVLDAGTCGVVIGTTTVLATHIDRKDADLDHGLVSIPSPLPGKWFVMAENGLGGKALDVFVTNLVYGDDALSTGPPPADAFERAERAAAGVAPGAGGVLHQPWLVGSLSPGNDRFARGGFLTIGLETTRAQLARAVYEGDAFNAAWLLPYVEALAGADWANVRFGGGGASSSLWAQILADALGKGVDQLADPRSTNARGAALLALAQLGHLALDDIPAVLGVAGRYEPQHDYSAMIERFVDAHETLRPLYERMNRRPR
jgi:xylulokinase